MSIRYLKETSLGVLDEKTLAAHCIFVSDSDIALLKESGVAVAHCIGANTKSAKGVAPLDAMLKAGLNVGLGTDGPSSGNTLDLFTQMRMVANFHKTHSRNRAAFPARDIVRLATLGGAEALGMDATIGSIERGKKADIVLVETDSMNMFPIFDLYSALVYSANASNVSYVFVDGKIVVKDKVLVTASASELRNNLANEMAYFKEKATEFSATL